MTPGPFAFCRFRQPAVTGFLFERFPDLHDTNFEIFLSGGAVRKVLLTSAVLVAASVISAFAADLPVKAPVAVAAPVTNWSGWYVGVEGGYGKSQFSQTNTVTNVSLGYYDQKGGLFGATVGYNWQAANWVWGLESDFSWANINGTQICGPTRTNVCSTNMRDLGTLRGRLGMTIFDNTLLYATAGLAYADIWATRDTGATEADNWRAALIGGGGVEWMFAPRWSLKGEYLYTSFPGTATTYTVIASSTPVAVVERSVHIFRGGINWHF